MIVNPKDTGVAVFVCLDRKLARLQMFKVLTCLLGEHDLRTHPVLSQKLTTPLVPQNWNPKLYL